MAGSNTATREVELGNDTATREVEEDLPIVPDMDEFEEEFPVVDDPGNDEEAEPEWLPCGGW